MMTSFSYVPGRTRGLLTLAIAAGIAGFSGPALAAGAGSGADQLRIDAQSSGLIVLAKNDGRDGGNWKRDGDGNDKGWNGDGNDWNGNKGNKNWGKNDKGWNGNGNDWNGNKGNNNWGKNDKGWNGNGNDWNGKKGNKNWGKNDKGWDGDGNWNNKKYGKGWNGHDKGWNDKGWDDYGHGWNGNWNRGYVGQWYRKPYYGELIGGIILGSLLAADGYGLPPYPPAPGLCWYWADPYMYRGYWDYCDY